MSREHFVAKACQCFLVNDKQGLRLPITEVVHDEDDPIELFANDAFNFSRNSLKRLFHPAAYRIVVVEKKGKYEQEHAFGLDKWVKLK